MAPRATIVLIVIAAAVISLQFTVPNQLLLKNVPPMRSTKLMSEKRFTAGRSLVIVLPPAEVDSTNKEVGCSIEELHTSGRSPILVYNVSFTCHPIKSLQEP